ncbi:ABC transporter permease [Pseudaeromonas sharmana]|uniref:ABC transporter permease n=1 Tax=Pseudaeromonas sharmana TaxID=328412 RepID=A0ABV8CRM7_9GAMM
MSRLKALWLQELSSLLADRAVLLTLFGGILFYAWLYPLPYAQQVARSLPILVVDEDNSVLSRRLAFMADATPQLVLVGQAATLREAEARIRQGEARGLLLIPQHFYRDVRLGRSVTLSLAGDGAYYLIYGAIAEGLSSAAATLGALVRIQRLSAEGGGPMVLQHWSPFSLQMQPVFNPTLGYQQYVVPAVFLFILQQTLLIGLGLRGVSEREQGLHLRGQGRVRLLLFMLLYLIFFMFYFGPCMAYYGLSRDAQPWQLLAFVLPFFLAAGLLGLLLGCVTARREMVTPMVILSSLPLLFASGFIWPTEMLPGPLQVVMSLLPTMPGINGLLRLNTMGADWSAVNGLWWQLWAQVITYGGLVWWIRRRTKSKPVA